MTPIRKKYASQFLIITLFIVMSTIFVLFIISQQVNNSLENTYYNKLNVTKNTLKENVESYFKNKSDFIYTVSVTKYIKESLVDFSSSFQKLENEYKEDINTDPLLSLFKDHQQKSVYNLPSASEKKPLVDYIPKSKNGLILQNMYIVENSFTSQEKYKYQKSTYNTSYEQVHQKYHKSFVDILKRHNFYDIFLIDKNGNIVYSVFKEFDLGTNLNKGIYSQSSLANAYKKSIKENKLSFSDFKPYEPSFNKPAAFFSIPVMKENERIGVIAFQVAIDDIDKLVTFNSKWEEIGLGKSGEAYLVGDDYLMRSNSRFKDTINNNLVKALDTTIGVIKIDSLAVKSGLAGEDANSKFEDYRGVSVLSSYTFVKVFDQVWALIVEIDEEEISSEIQGTIYKIVIATFSLIILIMLTVWLIISHNIIKPIENFEEKLDLKVKEQTKQLNALNKKLHEKVQKQLSQLREKDKMLLQQNKMAAIGEMLSNIAHQWRQPLAIISISASAMELSLELDEKVTKEESLEKLKKINKHSLYLSQTIDDFISFFNTNSAIFKEISIFRTLKKTEALFQGSMSDHNIKIIYEMDDDIFIDANENQIIQVLINIFNNSKDAFHKHENKNRIIFINLFKENENAIIEIKDNGGGIEEEIFEKIFDPYITTKHKSIGTGIGLYMSYQLINTVYNGSIVVKNVEYNHKNEQCKGAKFTIMIPLSLN